MGFEWKALRDGSGYSGPNEHPVPLHRWRLGRLRNPSASVRRRRLSIRMTAFATCPCARSAAKIVSVSTRTRTANYSTLSGISRRSPSAMIPSQAILPAGWRPSTFRAIQARATAVSLREPREMSTRARSRAIASGKTSAQTRESAGFRDTQRSAAFSRVWLAFCRSPREFHQRQFSPQTRNCVNLTSCDANSSWHHARNRLSSPRALCIANFVSRARTAHCLRLTQGR